MCTLSFLPTPEGLILGMNRDEQKSRIKAHPPIAHSLTKGFSCLGPSEPNGGMWIAAGQNGNVFALLNWYSVEPKGSGPYTSRGSIIPSLLYQTSLLPFRSDLEKITQEAFRPFRLVTFFTGIKTCIEWQYDGYGIMRLDHPWMSGLWASSGQNESAAQTSRKAVWDTLSNQGHLMSKGDLRGFHRSHSPQPGALSVCMHRGDAQTISYTEVVLRNNECSMHYVDGPPCESDEQSSATMPIQAKNNP